MQSVCIFFHICRKFELLSVVNMLKMNVRIVAFIDLIVSYDYVTYSVAFVIIVVMLVVINLQFNIC